jgi:hypothetical protein
MVGTCDACHGLDTVFWTELMEKNGVGTTPTAAMHTKSIQKLLKNNLD